MRRKKRFHPAAPYLAGFLTGCVVMLAVAALAALVLSLLGASAGSAGACALAALAAGSFAGGRVTGTLRRREGLKCGALCGLMILAPLAVISPFFGMGGWIMLLVKAAVCSAFAAAGGVAGVNSETR